MKSIVHLFPALGGILILCCLGACAFTDSTNVETSGIYMGYVVEHQSDSHIEVRAYPRVGGAFGTILTLDSGESITCNGTTLSHGVLNYYTTFSAPAVGDTYTFVFHRTDETITTILEVPAVPDTVTVTPDTNLNEWDPLVVDWNTAGSLAEDQVEIRISGTPVNSYVRSSLPDNGTYTVDEGIGTGLSSPDGAVAGAIAVSVVRYRLGTINADYQGGVVRGERWSAGASIPNFQPRLTLTLHVSPVASGLVTTEGSISGIKIDGDTRRFITGEDVTLTPVPESGWLFTGWSGDFTGSDNPASITGIAVNMDVTATFGAAP